MTIGPVSYTVIAFPGNRFNGNITPEVAKLIANGTVRILDLVFVGKDEAGDTISFEFDQMDELADFGDLEGEVGGLVNVEDLEHVAANLPRGTPRWSSCGRTCGPSRWSRRCERRAAWSSTRRASRTTWSSRRSTSWPRRSRAEPASTGRPGKDHRGRSRTCHWDDVRCYGRWGEQQ